METAPLKSFATRARTALIREVTARIASVTAPGSTERVEQAQAVAALEKALGVAGGGHKGQVIVADKVAYTWFNRITAMRFMDANGYTGIGVVSPRVGVEIGQPEILAEAKRGVVDIEVVSQKTRTIVAGLLDGTRASGDPQGEAYALLLADYCRHWNRAMPFMFESEGDYTELLIPTNLLADESLLDRSVKVLTEDVCEDVEVIGWLYQFYISERKDEVFAGFKNNKKAGADEIPAATQLFTPHWIVRYLVENSLGRLWMLNRPSSGLVSQMDYYIAPVDEVTDFLKIANPEELKIIDPACGSGHMLAYSFDLLYAIYEEEGYAPTDIAGLILSNNLHGTEIDPRAGALTAFTLMMKGRARQKTFFSKQVKPNVWTLDPIRFTLNEIDFLLTRDGDHHAESAFWNQFEHADTLGSLIQPDTELTVCLKQHLSGLKNGGELHRANVLDLAERVVLQATLLTDEYAVVIANPPYMGAKHMDSLLTSFAKSYYPASRADLFAMFIELCVRLAGPSGQIAMITMQSWMFLASFETLRRQILRDAPPVTMAHLGERAFDSIGGAVVSTTAFVLEEGRAQTERGVYLRLIDGKNEAEKESLARAMIDGASTHHVQPLSFVAIPGAPLAYWFPATLLEVFRTSPSLKTTARAAKGLVTGDNASFVRQWWEVSRSKIGFDYVNRAIAKTSGMRWFPYAKGGDFRRWAGNLEAVVNWEQDGRLIQTTLTDDGSRVRATNFNLDRILKQGIAWTVVTTNDPSFRKVENGSLFDAAAGLCQSSDDEYTLALLNSSAVKQVLTGLNPTMNLHPGYLGSVPVPADPERALARTAAARAVELSTKDWNTQERSWDFVMNPLISRNSSLSVSLEKAQADWAGWVTEMHKIEQQNDLHFARLFGFDDEIEVVAIDRVSLTVNPQFSYRELSDEDARSAQRGGAVRDLISYAVGCMFGRYSLDRPGLILADQGATLQDYFAKVPTPLLMPDTDNVMPIIDGDWFQYDIVERFGQFLRAAFGERHFEENLRFVTESLGVKNLRDYFVKSFYKDHLQRYKKRPIYWLFSSPKGSFNALIYMHRYTPSTVSTVLNEYLREFQAKLKASLEYAERSDNAKEADRLRRVLLELEEYEHDVLYPLALQNIAIDLDDGVKANYPKFGGALKKIPGLEVSE